MFRNINSRYFVYAAFFFSGISGLIYQTIWVRMLTRYLGSTVYATSTVLCVFMTGLAIGSLVCGRRIDRYRRLLLFYIVLEVLIAITAFLASTAMISGVGRLYIQIYPGLQGQTHLLLFARVAYAMICLLPPTVLMGASLPVVVAYLTRTDIRFQKGLGRLYTVNTLGAVVGVLSAGFVLIGQFGETISLIVAASFNILAAIIVIPLLKINRSGESGAVTPITVDSKMPAPHSTLIRRVSTVAIFISGFTALAIEILWIRLLILYLETSIYSFSFMLGTMLLGIAVGSGLSSRFRASFTNSVAIFALLEMLIGFWIIIGIIIFPWFDLGDRTNADWILRCGACVAVVMPIALFFGWQFPIAVRCCASDSSKPGSLTGGAYFANTAGTIIGSITAGFILLPTFGLARSLVFIAVINMVTGCVLMAIAPRAEQGRIVYAGRVVLTLALGLIWIVKDPYLTVIERRLARDFGETATLFSYHEGVDAVTIAAGKPGASVEKTLLINGIGVAVFVNETKLLTHLPLLLADDPENLLIICFGMGTTLRSASGYADLNIDVVDIIPEVFECFTHFHSDADRIRAMPNVNFHVGDGRNFLLVNKKSYDVITIDPSPPLYSAGTVNLYTREFLELCKSRLSENGVMCTWIPPDKFSEIAMIIKTFTNVFPGASLWGGIEYPGLFLTGGQRSFGRSSEEIRALATKISNIPEMGEWTKTYTNPAFVKDLYLLGPEDLKSMVRTVPELSDDRPYTEFPLWRANFTDFGKRDFSAREIRDYLRGRRR